MRILLVFIALLVIVMVAKRLWLQSRSQAPRRRRLSGNMVQCAHCGMYVPEFSSEANIHCVLLSREHDADALALRRQIGNELHRTQSITIF